MNIAKTRQSIAASQKAYSCLVLLLFYPTSSSQFDEGYGTVVTWSIRDETLHVEGMSQLFRTFISENPELWNDG